MLPNFNINAGSTIADLFLKKGVSTFHKAIETIHNLPYGRVDNPTDIGNVITQEKGTCSTKHATLKALAVEHGFNDIELTLAFYAMNGKNTSGIDKVLDSYELSYMLEAHCFLSYKGAIYDYTFPNNNTTEWQDSVITHKTIEAHQIGNFKKEYHKRAIKEWVERDNLSYSKEQLWSIREECIAALALPQ